MIQPSIALIYDRVNTPHGGAEKVLLALHQIFPEAPLYTSVYDQSLARWADVFKVKTSFLQRIPFAKNHHRLLVPLMPLAFESLDLSSFDIIISITSAEAKGVITRPNQLHVCYLLTPTRYLHSHYSEYLNDLPKLPFIKNIAQKLLNYLRWWDLVASTRPDVIVPISKLVKKRTDKYYRRKTLDVIYPPVDRLTTDNKKNNNLKLPSPPYYLVISRLVPYKRVNLAILACLRLKKKLVIIGQGPQREKLMSLAGGNSDIIFLTSVDSATKKTILDNCQGLLMLGIEDFGIAALEATLAKKAVVVHQNSGVAELLVNKQNAVFIDKLDLNTVSQAITKLETNKFNFTNLQQNMRKYTTSKFQDRFKRVVFNLWRQHQEGKTA